MIPGALGVPGSATSEGVAMPEFLTRLDEDPQSWTVGQGTPQRGDAWTDRESHRMRVPFGNDALARVIRAHEMMHAKASPANIAVASEHCGTSRSDIVAACEEIRINELVKAAGFDIDVLTDGSEKRTGVELAKMGPAGWNGIVQMVAATANTKASNSLIAGIRSENPALAKAAGEARKTIRKFVKDFHRNNWNPIETMGSTRSEGLVTAGFASFTEPLVQLVESFLIPQDDEQPGRDSEGDGEDPMGEIEEVVKAGQRGVFATLVLDQIPLTKRVDGRIGRKRIASSTGRHPRRMDRMLTDPERRVFDRRSRGKGGVVLIDQSGSMHLSDADIEQMIAAAPGCVIIGYSHRPGTVGKPNAWILANRGKVAGEVRSGNGGNGVDGPAVRLAVKMRRKGEPLIWVCDGHVTDGRGDQEYANLSDECARLVVKHGIHMVNHCEDGIDALRRASNGERLPTKATGGLYERVKRVQAYTGAGEAD